MNCLASINFVHSYRTFTEFRDFSGCTDIIMITNSWPTVMNLTETLLRLTGTAALALSFQFVAVDQASANSKVFLSGDSAQSQIAQFSDRGLQNYEPPDNGKPDSSDSSGTM